MGQVLSVSSCHQVCVLVAQSCPTLCDPMDCNPQGSSVHEIFQARILEWVAISFSGGPMHIHVSRGPHPGPCILVFLTPGLTFLKEEEVEQTVYPQGELFHGKRRAVTAPLLIGTGIAAALRTWIAGISTSAHFCYKLSQELN